MSDGANVRAALAAARAAVEAGDAATAEARLREAADLQERALGPLHPDLAETLNNLAIVSERLGRTAEAERCYRRAADIAAVALPASHPFVATSRENLRAFCEANRLPMETPKASTPAAPPREPEKHPEPPSHRPAQLFGLLLVVTVIVAAVFVSLRSRPSEPDEPAPAPQPAAAATSPTATPDPAFEPAPASIEPAPPPAPAAPSVPAPEPPPPSRSATSVSIVEARLCRSLSRSAAEWRCEAPAETVGSGPLYFYTRVRSPRDTSVSHRWYRADQLRQEVDLEIGANPSAGYRTFSLMTLPPDAAGPWRVEVRSADGALLHEETFTAGG